MNELEYTLWLEKRIKKLRRQLEKTHDEKVYQSMYAVLLSCEREYIRLTR